MNVEAMLHELGYATSKAEVERFQRDYNSFNPSSLLVSGKLDEPTRAAIRLAHRAKVMFVALRDGK